MDDGSSVGDEPRPGLAPGDRLPAGVMFAALYGALTPRPERPSDTEQDPYSLFHQRSLALGWLDESSTMPASGLWRMHDAGQDHPLATPEPSLAAWFQVGIGPVPGERPLPAQPFLRCAGDVVERLGRWRLGALHLLLPIQCLDTSSRPESARSPSLSTVGWFDECPEKSRMPVRVTLDSGRAPTIPLAAAGLRRELNRLEQNVFIGESESLTEHDPLTVRPPFDDSFWNGPPLNRVTFHGTIAEWSLDALGWLASFLADLVARHGVTTPVLLTALRP